VFLEISIPVLESFDQAVRTFSPRARHSQDRSSDAPQQGQGIIFGLATVLILRWQISAAVVTIIGGI
jgi:hypothetical protein